MASHPTARPAGARVILRRAGIAILVLLAVVVLALGGRCIYAYRDRHPGYSLKVEIGGAASTANPKQLQAGFARVKITPDVSNPNRPVWLAGFSQHRAATAVHDDLWAIAAVIDDGHTRLGIVALDAIGLFNDDVIEIRRRLPSDLKLAHTLICATHNHSTPDLMGLWGPDLFHTGVDPEYRRLVIESVVQALIEAAKALQPARVAFHEIQVPTEGLVADTRKPIVFDPDLRVMHFKRTDGNQTIGSIVAWANHPETPWGNNTEITSDFCGYLRDALEKGVIIDGRKLAAGLGGIHMYVNGAIGGLMTTHPSTIVRDPYLDRDFKQPSHEKARAVAHQLVSRLLPRLSDTNVQATTHAPISIRARTVLVPVDNIGFMAAPVLGLMDRGHTGWKRLRTEVSLATIGDASIAALPGEIYPEIVNGGIERPPGGDFDIEPVEVPPIRQLMPGRVKFVFGLANDEIGYVIPKSEWDRKPPYLYGSTRGVYGEVNSVGPETAPILHKAIAELCRSASK
ncbi:MAG: neutral/alkaline non-lysosomal ceramidase N-terminal domain-containing protein [Verrucomicrobiia bacterium]